MYGDTVYRIDRSGTMWFTGWKPRGTNTNISRYVRMNEPSIYVPSATTEEAAKEFGKVRIATSGSGEDHFYLYNHASPVWGRDSGVLVAEPIPGPERAGDCRRGCEPEHTPIQEGGSRWNRGGVDSNPAYESFDYETGEGLGPATLMGDSSHSSLGASSFDTAGSGGYGKPLRGVAIVDEKGVRSRIIRPAAAPTASPSERDGGHGYRGQILNCEF